MHVFKVLFIFLTVNSYISLFHPMVCFLFISFNHSFYFLSFLFSYFFHFLSSLFILLYFIFTLFFFFIFFIFPHLFLFFSILFSPFSFSLFLLNFLFVFSFIFSFTFIFSSLSFLFSFSLLFSIFLFFFSLFFYVTSSFLFCFICYIYNNIIQPMKLLLGMFCNTLLHDTFTLVTGNPSPRDTQSLAISWTVEHVHYVIFSQWVFSLHKASLMSTWLIVLYQIIFIYVFGYVQFGSLNFLRWGGAIRKRNQNNALHTILSG